MGLDMYLTREVHVDANWDRHNVTGTIDITKDGKKLPIDFNKVTTITEEVGYWRKANHIHQWFVDNCQDGEDDCRKHWVSKDKIIKLYNICKHVLATRDKPDGLEIAEKFLPTQEGFFFGDTSYDDRYYSIIKDTIQILKPYKNLDEDSGGSAFYYQSSW